MNNQPRKVLCDMIAKYGNSICGDRIRCSGFLRDMCGTYKAEISVLLSSLDEGVPSTLLNQSKTATAGLLIGRLAKKLQTDRMLTEEAAHWAVESWALALGVISSEDLSRQKPKPKHEPAPPQENISKSNQKSEQKTNSKPHPQSDDLFDPPPPNQNIQPQTQKDNNSWKTVLVVLFIVIISVLVLKNINDNRQAEIQAEKERLQAELEAKTQEERERLQAELEKKSRTLAYLLGGEWKLQWEMGGTVYQGHLVMNGEDGRGGLRVRYFDPVYRQYVTVDQNMVLKFHDTEKFFYLKGFNPRFAGTRFSHMQYAPDNFKLSQEEDGRISIIETCSNPGCTEVYSELLN